MHRKCGTEPSFASRLPLSACGPDKSSYIICSIEKMPLRQSRQGAADLWPRLVEVIPDLIWGPGHALPPRMVTIFVSSTIDWMWAAHFSNASRFSAA